VLADLIPDELNWVQFWCTYWKTIYVQAWMFFNEFLCLWRKMDLMIIPDNDEMTLFESEQLFQKLNRVT